MPFISSVRGSFAPSGRSKRICARDLFTGGEVTIAGGYRIHTFQTVGSEVFSTTEFGVPINVEAYVYGAGGASGSTNWGASNGWSFAGGGGFSGGTVAVPAGQLQVKVGAAGVFANGATLNEGGGAGGTGWGNGGGGGLSGLFSNNTYSFSNAILIAGGGGGGGTSRAGGQGVNRGGGGGGTTGQDGTSYSGNRHGRGGTQSGTQLPSAGDYSSGGWFAPGQLTGGHPEPHGAGGGGGYYGGSGGAYYEPNDMGGGGGGSSYASGLVSGASLTQASYQTVANQGGIYGSGSYGNGQSSSPSQAGQQGRVVIRYLI